jgi:hypothetical protein
MTTLKCKYAEEILIPDNGIFRDSEYKTADGQRVSVQFITTWNNRDGSFDNELDEICQRKWGIAFRAMKSVWISRLGTIGDYWHLIKLTKV